MQRFFLVIDSVETEIQQPEGWGDMQRSLSRQMDTFGFMEEFSKSDLTFYCTGSDLPGGLDLIQDAYLAKGPDADVYFKVIEDCGGDNIWETINYSLLDLYEAPNNADWYKAPTESESFQTVLSKRYKSQSNLLSDKSIDNTPVQVPALQTVFLPGKAIVREYEASPVLDFSSFLASQDPDQVENQRRPVLYFGFDNVKRNEFGVQTDDGNLPGVYTLGTGFSFTRDPLISIYDSIGHSRIKISLRIDNQVVIERNRGDFETVEIFYSLRIARASGNTDITLSHDLKGSIDGPYDSGDRLNVADYVSDWIDLEEGDKIYLWGDIDVRDVSGAYRMTYRVQLRKTSYLKIQGYTVSAGSDGYGLLVHEAFSKAVANLTGQDNILVSKFFGRVDSWLRTYADNGCGADFLFTIGKLLKGRLKEKDNTDIPLTTSLSTMMEGLQSIFCIGYSYEYEQGQERVVVEPMEYFFQDYEIISFDDISDFEISPAQDLIFNTIDVGYEKYETEEVNGADEFNSKRQYSTPVRKHESKLNLLSKLVTGGYPIEFTRQSRLRTNDYKYDNNNFLIAVKNETTVTPTQEVVSYPIIAINTPESQVFFPNGNVLTLDIAALEQLQNPYQEFNITDNVQFTGTYQVDFADDGVYAYVSISPVVSIDSEVAYGGNANFVIATVDVSTTIMTTKQDEDFAALNNVVDPATIYNAELSPVRNLLRWAKYINGGLTFKAPTEVIKFTYGEANFLFESQLKPEVECVGGDVDKVLLKENQDFALSAFNEFNKLWVAEYITFKAECSYGDFLTIRENLLPDIDKAQKNGYISIDYKGEEYNGYPIEINYEPNARICSFKLLRKYQNSL